MYRILHSSTLLLLFGISRLFAIPIVYPMKVRVNVEEVTFYSLEATNSENITVNPIDIMLYPIDDNNESNLSV